MTNAEQAWCAGFIKAAQEKGYSTGSSISILKSAANFRLPGNLGGVMGQVKQLGNGTMDVASTVSGAGDAAAHGLPMLSGAGGGQGGASSWLERNLPTILGNPGKSIGAGAGAMFGGGIAKGMGDSALTNAQAGANSPESHQLEVIRHALRAKLEQQQHPVQHAFSGLKDGFMDMLHNNPEYLAGGVGAGALGGAGLAAMMSGDKKKKPNMASSDVAAAQL